MTQHRLGILAVYYNKNRLEELSFYRKLSKYGNQIGLRVEVFTPGDFMSRNKVKVRIYDEKTDKWLCKQTTVPPLIYDRCRYHGVTTYRLLKAFRKKYHDLSYISKPLVNKWRMHHLLTENEDIQTFLPPTQKYNCISSLVAFVKKHKIVYAKPKNGTGGRGILRIEQISKHIYTIQGRNQQRQILTPLRLTEKQFAEKLNSLSLNGDYIIQKGIPLTLKDGRVHDYRLLIQKNGSGDWEITGCAGRIGPQKSITSNLHGGGTAIRMESLLQERFTSKEKVVKIKHKLGGFAHDLAVFLENKFGKLCELGIDIAIDPKGKIWLLEVNPKPSRDVFRRIGLKETYRNAITRPLEYAKWLLNQDKKASTKSIQPLELLE